MLSSNLNWDTCYNETPCNFSQPLQTKTKIVPSLCHDHFLQNPFKFIMHTSSCHWYHWYWQSQHYIKNTSYIFKSITALMNVKKGAKLDINVQNMKLYSIYNLRCSFLKYSIQSRLFISLLWQGSWITSNEVITGKINFIKILPFIKHILYSYYTHISHNSTDSTLLL